MHSIIPKGSGSRAPSMDIPGVSPYTGYHQRASAPHQSHQQQRRPGWDWMGHGNMGESGLAGRAESPEQRAVGRPCRYTVVDSVNVNWRAYFLVSCLENILYLDMARRAL